MRLPRNSHATISMSHVEQKPAQTERQEQQASRLRRWGRTDAATSASMPLGRTPARMISECAPTHTQEAAAPQSNLCAAVLLLRAVWHAPSGEEVNQIHSLHVRFRQLAITLVESRQQHIDSEMQK